MEGRQRREAGKTHLMVLPPFPSTAPMEAEGTRSLSPPPCRNAKKGVAAASCVRTWGGRGEEKAVLLLPASSRAGALDGRGHHLLCSKREVIATEKCLSSSTEWGHGCVG